MGLSCFRAISGMGLGLDGISVRGYSMSIALRCYYKKDEKYLSKPNPPLRLHLPTNQPQIVSTVRNDQRLNVEPFSTFEPIVN